MLLGCTWSHHSQDFAFFFRKMPEFNLTLFVVILEPSGEAQSPAVGSVLWQSHEVWEISHQDGVPKNSPPQHLEGLETKLTE